MYKFGAHVSIAGGITNIFDRIEKIGGNCIQIFSSSPRDWKFPVISSETKDEFIRLKEERKIDSLYFHANYLINLASGTEIGDKSEQLLIHELTIASTLGIRGSVVHTGSFFDPKNAPLELTTGKYATLIKHIEEILEQTPLDTLLLLENAGSRKIGMKLEELGFIIKSVGNARLKVCIDTAHLHAVGYSFATVNDVDHLVKEFDETIGLERLELIHFNDSKAGMGSFLDRHENLGEGKIGLSALSNILNHSVLKNYPFVLETPGFDDKGPDRQNMDILKGLVNTR